MTLFDKIRSLFGMNRGTHQTPTQQATDRKDAERAMDALTKRR